MTKKAKQYPPRRKKKPPVKGKAGKCTKKNLVIMYSILLYLYIMGGVLELSFGLFSEVRLLIISDYCDGRFHVVPLTVISCGILVVTSGIMGIFAATRDSMLLLVAVFRCLICLCLIEGVLFLMGLVLTVIKKGIYYDTLEKHVNEYNKFFEPVDRMQNRLKCCGYDNGTSDFPSGYPFSCCRKDVKVFCSELHPITCKTAVGNFIRDTGYATCMLCLLLLVIKVALSVIIWFFAKKIKHDVDYGEDEDPEKVKAREEKRRKRREIRLNIRHKKREKKKQKLKIYLAKKAKQKKKQKPKKEKKAKRQKPKKEKKAKKQKPKKEKKARKGKKPK